MCNEQTGTSLIFISHDLGVIRYLADRVAVMYRGEIVEMGTAEEIFSPPYHPYTEALLTSTFVARGDLEQQRIRSAEQTSDRYQDGGCVFSARCTRKIPGDRCEKIQPDFLEISTGHSIGCHLSVSELSAVPPVFRAMVMRSISPRPNRWLVEQRCSSSSSSSSPQMVRMEVGGSCITSIWE
jgi:peptide/nickel transport system ATP-binding protein